MGEKMEDRKETRKKKNIRVVLKDGDESYNVLVTTISRSGMSIKTDHVFPTYKAVDIIVKIDQKVIPIKGCIRWVNEPVPDTEDKQYGIGISLQNPPPEYLRNFD